MQNDPLIGHVYGTIAAGRLTRPAVEFESIRGFPVRIEDDSLDEMNIFHGDRVLVYSWMLDLWDETEYIHRIVMMIDANKRIHFGRYQPPHLLQSYGRAHRIEGLDLAGVVNAAIKSESRGRFE